MTGSVKRSYRATARALSAAETRARIISAAAALFASQGYAATSLKQVAAQAGVGERTLYDAYGGKFELYRQTLNVVTVGDEERIPVRERPHLVRAREATDPRVALELHTGYGADLMERAGDVIMAGLEASGADVELRPRMLRGVTSVHGIHLALTETLAERGQLKPGLDAGSAADQLYAIGGPATFQMLRRHRDWTPEQYRQWLFETAVLMLLP